MKIGDEVICIKSHPEGVTKQGKHYFIKEIIACSCGNPILYFGHSAKLYSPQAYGTRCSKCGDRTTDGKWWQGMERFRKIERFTNALTKELADDFIEKDGQPEIEKEEVLS